MKLKQYQIKKPDTTTVRTTLFFILALMFFIVSVNAKTIDELLPSLDTIQSPGSEADQFGSSIVRIDNLLFVGAPNNSSNGTLSGAVFVYQRQTSDTGKWTHVNTLHPLNPEPGERFGYSLATNQTELLIGAPASSQHATDIGAVYVFSVDEPSQTWRQSVKLTAADGQPGDRFGFSIAIEGATALIGAFLDDNDPLAQQTIQKLKPVKLDTDDCPENSFCQHNSSLNKTIPKQTYVFEKEVSDDPGVDSGSVYVFTQNSNNQWTQAHKLTANNSEGSDFFGFQLGIENNIAVISAPGKDHLDELSAGAVYLFKRNGNLNSAWQQIQILRASDGKLDDLFGQSVAFHQQTIAIGAHKKDRIAQNTGSVYVFEPSNLGDQWIETGQLYNPDPTAQDQFGHGIALNDSLILITAYNERINTPGAVYLFEKSTNSQSQSGWAFADQISLAPNQLERIGSSIMLDHQAFAFGALDHSGNSNIVIASNTNISHVEQPTPVQPPTNVTPSNGLWWNPQQPGHGLDIKLAGDNLLAIWYTYRQDGTPVWYLASGPYQNTQPDWPANLDLYHWDAQQASARSAGTIRLTFTDSSHAQLSWTINGDSGTQPIESYHASNQFSASDISGTWYEQQKPGYGLTGSIQGNTEIAVLYFYDSAGNPAWVLGSNDNPQADSIPVDAYQGACPGCPFTASTANPAGTLSTQYSSPASGRLSTNIQLPPPLSGSWIINDVAITNLAWNLSSNQGALTIISQTQFQQLANAGRSIGVSGRPEIKFLIDDVDTDTPRLFFINSKNGTEGTYHYDFARDVLKQYTDLNYRDGQALFSS
ncbi:MAG: FG-GAP repeat protein, partial [Gammaproteobacteria bacterium]|nr:FG-GAP repeat protein [Gammaproteobacteria bacterium]